MFDKCVTRQLYYFLFDSYCFDLGSNEFIQI
jgi:hypothetical protein